ncbi:hypothetical protein MRB53_039707 [Persea americana]|nr:hypothetical protein MRB53_039707 [Persea americana]
MSTGCSSVCKCTQRQRLHTYRRDRINGERHFWCDQLLVNVDSVMQCLALSSRREASQRQALGRDLSHASIAASGTHSRTAFPPVSASTGHGEGQIATTL